MSQLKTACLTHKFCSPHVGGITTGLEYYASTINLFNAGIFENNLSMKIVQAEINYEVRMQSTGGVFLIEPLFQLNLGAFSVSASGYSGTGLDRYSDTTGQTSVQGGIQTLAPSTASAAVTVRDSILFSQVSLKPIGIGDNGSGTSLGWSRGIGKTETVFPMPYYIIMPEQGLYLTTMVFHQENASANVTFRLQYFIKFKYLLE